MLEQEFQQLLRPAVTRALGNRVRLWRQPSGKIQAARGGSVECAPVGAADLTGIVAPTGARIEIELKGARTPTTDEQVLWRESMAARGAVALQLRYDRTLDIDRNIALACAEISRAVAPAACVHPDGALTSHPAGGVWCTRCWWRSGGRAREVAP